MPIPEHILKRVENSKLPHVNIANCGLTDDDVKDLVILINANPNINSVNLDTNIIGDLGAIYLSSFIRVKVLSLAKNNIGNQGLMSLIKNRTITTLNFCNNMINDEGINALLKENITHLDMINFNEPFVSAAAIESINNYLVFSKGKTCLVNLPEKKAIRESSTANGCLKSFFTTNKKDMGSKTNNDTLAKSVVNKPNSV